LLIFDQPLFGLRGEKRSIVRSASSLRCTLSIQPKQSASSTASSHETRVLPVSFRKYTNQTPVALA
jgi:hypothetical protein